MLYETNKDIGSSGDQGLGHPEIRRLGKLSLISKFPGLPVPDHQISRYPANSPEQSDKKGASILCQKK
jgi:hypothetical protein